MWIGPIIGSTPTRIQVRLLRVGRIFGAINNFAASVQAGGQAEPYPPQGDPSGDLEIDIDGDGNPEFALRDGVLEVDLDDDGTVDARIPVPPQN